MEIICNFYVLVLNDTLMTNTRNVTPFSIKFLRRVYFEIVTSPTDPPQPLTPSYHYLFSMPPTSNLNEAMSSPQVKMESPAMKLEEEPPSKKPRKDDDERVHRAAMLMIKSQNLSVPQVRQFRYQRGCATLSFRNFFAHI